MSHSGSLREVTQSLQNRESGISSSYHNTLLSSRRMFPKRHQNYETVTSNLKFDKALDLIFLD